MFMRSNIACVPRIIVCSSVSLAFAAGAALGASATNIRPVGPLGNNDLADLLSHTPSQSPPGIYNGGPIFNAVDDQSAQAVFTNTSSGGSIGTFAATMSGLLAANRLGIYDVENPSKQVEIFNEADSVSDQVLVSFYADGTVRVNFVDSGVTGFSGNFGFYLGVYGASVASGGDGDPATLDHTFYTQDALNPGSAAQTLIYRGNGVTQLVLPGYSAGTFSTFHWLIAFEDGLVGSGLSDRDYSDFVVYFESLAPGVVRCGNGVVDAGEACDDGNTIDNDACSNNCTSGCGNGILNTGEDCDGTEFEAGAPSSHGPCRADCKYCGNGTVDGTEKCDDGNSVDTDGCRNNCTRCGDNHRDAGEECDGTDTAVACPGQCTSSCTCPVAPAGCRITGGRTGPNGTPDANPFEDIIRGQGGGQVGAPCGCIGCFTTPDPNDDLAFQHIQGNWQYSRKVKNGNFHAKEFNSLICGCDATSPACASTGVAGAGFITPANFSHGLLCNPDDRIPGPEPRPSPANIACFSGIGAWSDSNGRKDKLVAFRVEVEDRGEPAVGPNSDDTCDVHRIRIWIPTGSQDVKLLADGACCTNAVPVGLAARAPDIDDGGNLTKGNIQIHPQTPNSQDGTCPVPDGACQQ
jgi:cysteine-rich repeat protein